MAHAEHCYSSAECGQLLDSCSALPLLSARACVTSPQGRAPPLGGQPVHDYALHPRVLDRVKSLLSRCCVWSVTSTFWIRVENRTVEFVRAFVNHKQCDVITRQGNVLHLRFSESPSRYFQATRLCCFLECICISHAWDIPHSTHPLFNLCKRYRHSQRERTKLIRLRACRLSTTP